MSYNCNRQMNSGVGADRDRGDENNEYGPKCGCGSYYCNCRNCICRNNTMNAGTAGLNNSRPNRQGVGIGANNEMTGELRLATSYVLPQRYMQSYTPEESLARGTCFPELDI